MESSEQSQETSFFDLNISESVIYSLTETCRWARFLAYVSASAIVLGFILLAIAWGDLERTAYGGYENVLLGAAVVIALIYSVFIILLFNFSMRVKKGVEERDINKIEAGMSSLKIYFILSGIGGVVYVLLLAFGFLNLTYR